MRATRMICLGCFIIGWCSAISECSSDEVPESIGPALRKIGGFYCADLRPYTNDTTFDLYQIGAWTYSAFTQDIWKRHGVPFWYPRGMGSIFVAGERWTSPVHPDVSSAEYGGVARADNQQPGNGAIDSANDDNLSTYWYAGDNRPQGKLTIDFAQVERVTSVRFLGFATGRHAPRDYRIGVILPDGSETDIAAVQDEKRIGQWISFDAHGIEAKGIFLEVAATVENEHGPVVYELQARTATPRPTAKRPQVPSEVVIPLHGIGAEEFFVVGNVGRELNKPSKAGATVGQYVVTYESGQEEMIPLVVGNNVADVRYGHFVPDAEPAFMMPDQFSAEGEGPSELSYHLDEMLPVEPKKQLMMFGHQFTHPAAPLKSLSLRVTDPEVGLYLTALTLRQSGPRMNALFYNGKMVHPIPAGTPKVAPSILDALRDTRKELSLNGPWLYKLDPGHVGINLKYFAADADMSTWKTMPVPSQWYVQGIDYHGVVWFRRDVDVPAEFPGTVTELCFGAVDYDARVWVNGQYVGRHLGAFSHFKFDVTSALKKGVRNTIVVRVDSPLDPGFTGRKTMPKGNAMEDIAMAYNEEGSMGGIYRSVRLQGRGHVGIEDAWAQSTISADLKHADVKIQFALRPQSPTTEELTVKCALKETNSGTEHVVKAKHALGAEACSPVDLTLAIDNPKLWYPWEQEEPYLYLMEIEVWDGNELLDKHVSRVGIREVSFDATLHRVSINHHRIFLKGFLNDDVHWMSLVDRSGYAQRLKMQKDAGVNIIRLTTHQSSPEMYDLCNEMGMMIWQELPLQWGYSSSEPVRRDILQVARETMVQTRPHPCVIGYSAWNEGGQVDFTGKVVAIMQELDATRPMSRACGGGDWDVHFYNDMSASRTRMTPLWTGFTFGFISEIGSYGLPSEEDMHSILGPDLFRFDSAEYYWESFCQYRQVCGPIFLDAPPAPDWPTEKIRQYVLAKQPATERYLALYVKSAFENFRGQRFAPTTALIHCRFDDAVPSSQLGVVSFNGRPRKAYFAAKESLQTVLPMLFFDFTGAEDLRVINDYWHRSWAGCVLHYTLSDRNGATIKHVERTFDLPADATIQVLTREEVGDIWRLPGFLAELRIVTADGAVLSENHYDMTTEEILAFVTNVYPRAPIMPVAAIVLKGTEAVELRGSHREVEATDAYSEKLLELGGDGEGCAAEFEINVPHAGDYFIRAACQSGHALQEFDLTIDRIKAPRESVPYLDMTLGITRQPYSSHNLTWVPGWQVTLSAGTHRLALERTQRHQAPALFLDAIGVQPTRDLLLTP
ncbi:MAG: sugar-binding domain-containing protein [Pirellulaceae bacterium]